MGTVMDWVLMGAAGVSWGVVVWVGLSRPRRIRWTRPTGWLHRVIAGGAGRLWRQLSPTVLRQAETLHISSRDLFWSGLGWAVGTGVGVGVIATWRGLPWMMGLVAAALAFYVAPSVTVRSRFRRYQNVMRLAFETQVLLLRIYFDLGMSLTTALRTMRDALGGHAQQELDQVLRDLATGQRAAALVAWADRTQLDEYLMLADTLVQQRGRALQGNALDPLDTLLTAGRQQSMKTLTNRLTAGASATPILATLALVILYLYALFASIPGMHALRWG